MPIWVETTIRAPLEEVWRRTQDPALHAQWDLRFSAIDYLPRTDESEPQRFLYRTRIGFGLQIRGEGESRGEREAGGARTSALRFWSDDGKSLIREGSGYWKYVPVPEGVRFLTVYDYTTRFGVLGKALDRAVCRPLMAWATAWSFDRLRRWCERGTPPVVAARQALARATARLALALVWIYQGLVPKLLFPEMGELATVRAAVGARAPAVLLVIALAELGYGLALLLAWRSRLLPALAIPGLLVLFGAGVRADPAMLTTPFNTPTLTVATMALAAVDLLLLRDVPSSAGCRWSSRKGRAERAASAGR
ncbi:MAG TPA: DoxX-like family protein [Thermoanaerobaculia bacterium]|jgi:uncharacterized membrane protein YphA (DoxX/SURF4 family)|nr:DoxX-like family protein [Thermoanaerobaculia bacterium]